MPNIGRDYKLIYHGFTNTKKVVIVVSEDLQCRVAEVPRLPDRLISVAIDADDRRI